MVSRKERRYQEYKSRRHMPGWVVFNDGDGLQAAGSPRIDSTDVGLRVFLRPDGPKHNAPRPLLRLHASYLTEMNEKLETFCDFDLAVLRGIDVQRVEDVDLSLETPPALSNNPAFKGEPRDRQLWCLKLRYGGDDLPFIDFETAMEAANAQQAMELLTLQKLRHSHSLAFYTRRPKIPKMARDLESCWKRYMQDQPRSRL